MQQSKWSRAYPQINSNFMKQKIRVKREIGVSRHAALKRRREKSGNEDTLWTGCFFFFVYSKHNDVVINP